MKMSQIHTYIDMVKTIEKTHRLILEIINEELLRNDINDISSIQAMLLISIEGTGTKITSIKTRGYYLGSNLSYNLKKLVDNDFLSYNRDLDDNRVIRVMLTPKGVKIKAILDSLFSKQEIGALSSDVVKLNGEVDIFAYENYLRQSLGCSKL